MTADDRGLSLIEVLITIVLMGIGVTALLTGMLTASRGAADNRATADARQALISTAERVVQVAYAGCAGAGDPQGPYPTARLAVQTANDDGGNAGVGASVTRVEYWDGNAFTTACPAGAYDRNAANVSRMQRFTLLAGAESLVLVKRDVQP